MAPVDSLGMHVRALRQRAGLTQAELAVEACISRRTVARIEAGWQGANRSTLALLAQALGVTVEDLANGEAA